jgi:general nucleoside transport system ATP-binding protein
MTLRNSGCAVLVVSEELDELFEITDRMYVMAQGQLSPSVLTAEANSALIGRWMSAMWADDASPVAQI